VTRSRLQWPAQPMPIGLVLIVIIQAAAAVGYTLLGAGWFVWAGLAVSLGIAVGLAWVSRRREAASLSRLSSVCQVLADDCDTLSSAVADLGRGNLEARVALRPHSIETPTTDDSDPALREINSTVARLHTVAQEFNDLTAEPLQRLVYVGADSYLEGRICGDAMGRALGGHGQVVITIAYPILAPIVVRRKGFESMLRERYPGVRVVDVVETTFDTECGYRRCLEVIAQRPDLQGIYVTDGAVGPGVARAVTEQGLSGRIVVIAHDLVGDTVHYMREGTIYATLSQNLFAQGHDSVIHLFNHLATGWHPPHSRLLTHLQMVTRADSDHLRQEEWVTGDAVAPGVRLAEPMQRTSRPLRIAVQNRDASAVDRLLQMGAAAAAAKLRPYGAHVDILPGGTLSVQPIVDNVVAQGYDAMTVLAANKQDALSLQRAAEAGVVLATYNAEPLSLRAWVGSLADRACDLLAAGDNRGTGSTQRDPVGLPLAASTQRQRAEHSELVRQAIAFMQENFESPISVVDVAQYVALDPSYFCRLFTAQTGRNPSDFLIDLRLEQAKQYLARGEMSVMDVCVALGYSPSYFSRLFKRRVGCTPSQYSADRAHVR
jgi:ABC-type sugar transport system substrate-binding protein/AraC-like DNA-binding protein